MRLGGVSPLMLQQMVSYSNCHADSVQMPQVFEDQSFHQTLESTLRIAHDGPSVRQHIQPEARGILPDIVLSVTIVQL